MPRAYSDDLRCKLLEAYEAGQGSLQELAKQFRVSWGYSKKIRAQQLRTKRKERPQQLRHGPASRLTPAVEQQLRSALRQQPDLSLAEVQQRLAERAGIGISRSRLWVWLQRLGLRHKKNRSGRKNRTAGEPLAPAELVGTGKRVGSGLSGVSRRERRHHRNDAPLWLGAATGTRFGSGSRRPLAHADGAGRADLGWRARQHEHRVAHRWRCLSRLCGTGAGAAAGTRACRDPRQPECSQGCWCPRIDRSPRAQLLYLPPYSPDLNPIEMAWSKLKQRLRGVKARVLEQLEPALADALSAITPQNAQAFFRHCGYGIQQL